MQNSTDIDNTVIEGNGKQASLSATSALQDRKLNVIVIGLPEETGETPAERTTQLEFKVCNVAETVKCNPKMAIADYYRLGKYSSEKRRPILVKLSNIWEKRKMLAEFQKIRAESRGREPHFLIKEDRPMTQKHKEARDQARTLNEKEKMKAQKEKRSITASFSGRSDGSVVMYNLIQGKWTRNTSRNED